MPVKSIILLYCSLGAKCPRARLLPKSFVCAGSAKKVQNKPCQSLAIAAPIIIKGNKIWKYEKLWKNSEHIFTFVFCVVLATFSLIDATSWKRHLYSLNLLCAAAYAYSHSHSHSHSHTPACAWAWGRGIDACIMSPNGSNNYKVEAFCMAGVAIIMTITRGPTGEWQERGLGGWWWMIAWAAVVASLSGLLLLICCNYSPSHSNIYENFFLLHQNLCATCSPCPCGRAKGGAQPLFRPLSLCPLPLSLSLAVPRQCPLAIIRRNKRQLSEAN